MSCFRIGTSYGGKIFQARRYLGFVSKISLLSFLYGSRPTVCPAKILKLFPNPSNTLKDLKISNIMCLYKMEEQKIQDILKSLSTLCRSLMYKSFALCQLLHSMVCAVLSMRFKVGGYLGTAPAGVIREAQENFSLENL